MLCSPRNLSSASQEKKESRSGPEAIHSTLCSSSLIVIITVAFQPLHPFLSSIHHTANVNEECASEGEPTAAETQNIYSSINNKQVFEWVLLIQGGSVFNSRSAISYKVTFTTSALHMGSSVGTLPPSASSHKCSEAGH